MQTPTKYYIYLTTFPDGKVYCGKHTDDGDPYIGSGNFVDRFQKEYPNWRQLLKEGTITNEILEYTSKEMLNLMEILWIDRVRRVYGDLCVNEADGGQGGNMGDIWYEHLCAANRKSAKDPVWKEHHAEGIRRIWQDPDFRERKAAVTAESNRRMAQDPVWREHTIPAVSAANSKRFLYQNPDTGETRDMTRGNAARWLKGWICLGEITITIK